MKRYGRIPQIMLALLVIIGVFTTAYLTQGPIQEARAATDKTHVIAIQADMGEGFDAIDSSVAIITDLATLDMMHKTTGVADATRTNCEIDMVADGQNTDWAKGTAPALDTSKRYAITFYQATGGTTAALGPLRYDPITGETFTDANPTKDTKVRVVNE